jgi:hypothetical protein
METVCFSESLGLPAGAQGVITQENNVLMDVRT